MFASISIEREACPIRLLDAAGLDVWLESADAFQRQWLETNRFKARPGQYLVVPGDDGNPQVVLVGYEQQPDLWTLAGLPARLNGGLYQIDAAAEFGHGVREKLALGWAFGHYQFDRYKPSEWPNCQLILDDALRQRVEILRDASFRVRDWVNTPACDLGPAELAEIANELAERNQADFTVIEGEQLEKEFPAIHAVGQAASRAPRLVCVKWGDKNHPPLALVGKGVIFDSGGLNIKPGAGMVLMKKDMGGAAHVLGLAELIMRFKLPVHLRVYIPAVENAIAGNAYRPSDIVTTRNGTTVEIGNTDAEGRVVLSDALTLASEEGAERIIDFATLTGAARIALGEDLPPLYARDDQIARAIQDLSFELDDPLWHMPLYEPYRKQIQPKIADLSNTGTSNFGGSLTAALFLDHFVDDEIDWLHLDVYAWNVGHRPGRPAGGEAQGIRAMYAWLESQYR
ncbi:MAG: leucyl aminopeptidase family protein [Pseudomonadota bacterium]